MGKTGNCTIAAGRYKAGNISMDFRLSKKLIQTIAVGEESDLITGGFQFASENTNLLPASTAARRGVSLNDDSFLCPVVY